MFERRKPNRHGGESPSRPGADLSLFQGARIGSMSSVSANGDIHDSVPARDSLDLFLAGPLPSTGKVIFPTTQSFVSRKSRLCFLPRGSYAFSDSHLLVLSMAPERARRTSRRRTNQESYSPGPSSTMTLRSTMRKSQDANATITSRSTTVISTPTAVTGTAAGESNLLPAFHSSVDLVSHDLPLEARMLSNLAPLDTVVTPEGSTADTVKLL
ncbi:hypothetical protein FB446DRAFT_793008 [Lentinula raphanica]|nr:hypothetical protein FB446DRAFT_793008 [Lentinula raphanica]